jgi:hypothetical protein
MIVDEMLTNRYGQIVLLQERIFSLVRHQTLSAAYQQMYKSLCRQEQCKVCDGISSCTPYNVLIDASAPRLNALPNAPFLWVILGTTSIFSSVVAQIPFGITKIRRYSAHSKQMMAAKVEMLIAMLLMIRKACLVP